MGLVKRRGFEFEETMVGTYALTDAPGDRRPLSVTLRVQADSVLGHLRDGKASLRGTLRADGFADESQAEGTLALSAARRTIRYHLQFTGGDGAPYRFEGQKRLRLTRPLRSMTELFGDLLDGSGGVVGTAELRFDLRSELVPFLASWRPA